MYLLISTCVLERGGKLLALWEGGWPTVMDPKTLITTQNDFDFSGNITQLNSY